MGKSLKRVTQAIADLGLQTEVVETGTAKTAQQAADALGVGVDQIAKSIIFAGADTGTLYLFLTAGAQHVDPEKAAHVAGEPLVKADAGVVRKVTGFAIGGVSPIGHLTPITAFLDETLFQFGQIYAAAGTPNHVFGTTPDMLWSVTKAERSNFTAKM